MTGSRLLRVIPRPYRAVIVLAGALGVLGWATERFDIDLPPALEQPEQQPTAAVVTGYRDGDTFTSTAGPIRLENVEAAESKPHKWKCDDPGLAAAALAHLQALAPVGTTVQLRIDHDSYDRHVAWVTLPDGTDLGAALLATRTVTTYPNPSGACPGGAA